MYNRLIYIVIMLHLCFLSMYESDSMQEYYGNDRINLEAYSKIRDASKIITYIKDEIANSTTERVRNVLKLTRQIDNDHKARIDRNLKNMLEALLQSQSITISNKKLGIVSLLFILIVETNK